ncbi:hypothetical protein KKD52_01585 [Myxococcota bacterium]|nr:hypothetical protein [Myxococcota bacterium]
MSVLFRAAGTPFSGSVMQDFCLQPAGSLRPGAVLREVRFEPGTVPRIHMKIVHPVYQEVQITIVSLPSGVQIEVRCARPERLSPCWPRMGPRHRVRFVRTSPGGPVKPF